MECDKGFVAKTCLFKFCFDISATSPCPFLATRCGRRFLALSHARLPWTRSSIVTEASGERTCGWAKHARFRVSATQVALWNLLTWIASSLKQNRGLWHLLAFCMSPSTLRDFVSRVEGCGNKALTTTRNRQDGMMLIKQPAHQGWWEGTGWALQACQSIPSGSWLVRIGCVNR